MSGLPKRTSHTAIPTRVRNAIVGIALLCASLSATAAYADFPQPVTGDQYTIEQMLSASSQVNGNEMSIDGWATDADGYLWTVENDSLGGTLGTSRLVKRMPNGTIVQTYGMGMNPSAGDLWDARAVAIHPSTGDIYVADSLNNRIAIFRHNDAFYLGSHGGPAQSVLTTITDEPYGLAYPNDLEFDTQGNLYVVDRDNNRVVKYDATLTFVTAFGVAGGQDVTDRTQNLHGGFYSPSGISIDASSNVWVADAWNNRIEKFSPDGAWLDSLRPAKAGGAEDEFQTPLDVTVDGYGTIYVADSPGWAPFSSGRFSRWGAQKDPLGQYGDQKPLGGAIILPSKLTVDTWGGVSINDNDPYDTAPGVLERWGLNAGEPDVTPPVTTTDASSSWVNSAVTAHLQAIDASSPVVGTYWSSDGSTPTAAYEGSITVSAEGTTTLKYFSVDRPGNAEAVKSHSVRIDYNAPVSQSSIVATYYGQAVISLTATDALSGAQDIWYRLDGGSPTLGGTVIVNIQGPHHLEYWAEDAAGNKEAHHAQVFTVMPDDADPPITYWAQYSPDWFRSNPQITLIATDTVSGVASTLYSMNGSDPTTYTGSFSWSQEGTTTMQFWSVDNLGHVEATQTDLIRVDKGAPTSWADVPVGAIGNATVRFYASDSVSGVSTFKWSLNGTDWFQGDSAFIPTYGNHTLRYYAIDNAGNAEAQHFTPVTVLQPDFNAPDTTSNVPLSGWVKGPYPLQLDAVDDISGVQASWYDLDDAGWTIWQPNSVWVTDGIHSVKFYSVDNRGNVEATHTATLKVDSGAPITTTDAQPVYAGATTIHFYPTDALSTTQTYYRVDTNPVQSGTSVALSEFRAYTLEYWSVDDAGNEEAHHTVSVAVNPPDNVPPVTTYTGPSGWQKGYALFSLSAVDASSTVKYIFYSLNGSYDVPYSNPVNVSTEGTNTVKYHAVDFFNNVETSKTAEIKVDASPPVTTSDAIENYTEQAPITFTPTDAYSGVATTYYRVNGGAWQQGTFVNILWSRWRRYHTVDWYSVDAVGNVEATKSATVAVRLNSQTYPSSDSNIVYRDNWYSTAGGDSRSQNTSGSFALISFQGTRFDLLSRMGPSQGKMRVSLVDSSTMTSEVDLYDSVNRDGNNIAPVWSTGDLDFNDYIVKVEWLGTRNPLSSGTEINIDDVKTEGSITQVPDSEAPATTHNAPAGWVDGPVSVTLSSTDATTGVSAIYAALDATPSVGTTYTAPVSVVAEGTHAVKFYGVDRRGNAEAIKSATVRVDNTAPVTNSNALSSYVGTASVSLFPSDIYSGLAYTKWRVDGAAWTTGTAVSVPASALGAHVLEWYSVDNIGHVEATKSASLRVLARTEQTDSRITYRGSWTTTSNASHSAGTVGRTSGPAPAAAYATFKGTSVDLIAQKASSFGIAEVSLDGAAPVDVDLYSASTAYKTVAWSAVGLADTTHTVSVTYSGRKNAASSGTTIDLDAIDVAGTLVADTAPPVTTCSVGSSAWRSGTETVTLSAVETDTYVATTYYRINDGTLTAYTGPFPVTAEGTNTVTYYSVDGAGNAEATKTATVRIDRTAPVSSDNAPSGWVDGPVNVTLSSADPLSGVSGITYRLDGATQQAYSSPITITAEGTHTLTYQATDAVGNVEDVRTVTIRIDNTAPVSSDNAPSGWVDGPVIVTLTPADPVSGVNALLYSIDGSEPTIPYTTPLVIAAQGVTTIKYAAIDIKGNIEQTKTTTVSIDDIAPVTNDNAPSAWVNGPVDVTLVANDLTSGVAQTRYVLDGGPLTSYAATSPITITAEGTHTILYASTDVKGNIEATKTATVRIDNTAPVSSDNAPGGWVNGPVNVALSSTDPPSGVSGITYRLDGATQQDYATPIAITAEGTHTLTYQATDAVGNVEDMRTVTIRIDDTAPVSSDNAPGGWVDGPVDVALSSLDEFSGVQEIRFSLDELPLATYTAPIHVSGDGTHVLTYAAVDAIGNSEATRTVNVRIDTTDPSVTDDAPGGWVNGPVTVRLDATDEGAGVQTVLYSTDGSAPSLAYGGSIVVSDEGTTTVRYRATDKLGHVSAIKTAVVRIDDSTPVSSDDAPAGWVQGPVSVTLSSIDVLSGVSALGYALDGQPGVSYTAPVEISGEGTHTLLYGSVDVVGNNEATRTATVRIDNTDPVTSGNVASTYTGAASIALSPVDSLSGVATTKYRLDGGTWSTGTTLTVPAASVGGHTLEWYSVDAAGNAEATHTANFDLYKRIEQNNSRIYYHSPTGAWSTTSDANLSGLTHTKSTVSGASVNLVFTGTAIDWYTAKNRDYGIARVTLDGGTPVLVDLYASSVQWKQKVFSVSGLANTTHRLKIENTGTKNASATGFTIAVDAFDVITDLVADTVPPVTTSNADPAWQSSNATITLSASDAQTSVKYSFYRVNGGTVTTYTAPFVIATEGTSDIEFYSVDVAGNREATQTATVNVDKTAPTIDCDAPSAWRTDSVTAHLTAADAGSGVSQILYSIDGSDPSVPYDGSISVTAEGITNLRFKAIDAVGRQSIVGSTPIRIDVTAPSTDDDAPAGWVGGPVSLHLSAADPLSGVASTTYELDGAGAATYAGSIVVSGDGTHTIAYASVDALGNQEATSSATVRIDDTAPVTTDNAPTGWFTSPVLVSLDAQDAASGVAYTLYSLDGTDPSIPYTGAIAVSSQGSTTLRYRSVDVKGNFEAIQTRTITVDDVAPVTTDDAPSGWSSSPATITLSADDSASGVLFTEYRLNGAAWTAYDAPFVVAAEGTTTLEYRSTDTRGNIEDTRTATVRIDLSVPSVFDDAPATWAAGPVSVALYPADQYSGVASTLYSVDGTDPSVPYAGAIAVTAEGTTTVRYRSTDAVGNQTSVMSTTVRIDTTGPDATDDAPAGWVAQAPVVHLSATDAGSGVAGINYSVDGTDPKTPYTSGVSVTAEGTTIVRYAATDNLGNVGPTRQVTVRLDRTAPTSSDNATTTWVADGAAISLATTDAGSGANAPTYVLDGSAPVTYSDPITVTGGGVHSLLYRASDQVGNTEATRTATVRIDTTAPTTTSDASAASYTGTATISLIPTDTQAGVAATFWRVDGAAWSTGTSATIGASQVGTHSVEWYSVDAVGNAEAIKSASVKVVRRYEQDDALASYTGTWSLSTDVKMSEGNARFVAVAGNTVDVAFTGTHFEWIGPKGPSYGLAKVTLDGGTETIVDLYSASLQYKQIAWASGTLADGPHNVRIECLGQKGLGSSTGVTIDAFDVIGSLAPRRYEQDNSTVFYSGTWNQNSDPSMSGGSYKFTSVTSSTVEVTFWGKRIDWIAAKGGSYGIAKVTLDGVESNVDLYNNGLKYKQTVWSSGTLTDGRHTLRIECTGSKNASSTGTGIHVDSLDIVGYPVPMRFEQDDRMTSYTGTWSQNSDGSMSGGTYRFSSVASSVVDVSFWGKRIDWIAAKGGSYGIAKVTLDGVSTDVDLYNNGLKYKQAAWTSGTIAEGRHTLRIECTGSKNASSTGTGINIDSFDVVGSLQPRRYEQDYYMSSYAGTWAQNSDSGMSGGTYKFSSVASSTVDLTFWGKSVDWIAAKGGSYGIAKVTLDGVPVNVDLYNNGLKYKQVAWSSGTLTDGRHTLRIESSGTKNAASAGTGINVDSLDIVGYVIPRRFEQDDALSSYQGTWTQTNDAGMSGGSYRHSTTAGSALNVTFSGTGLTWIGAKGPNYGFAKVTLDGTNETTIDLYNSSLRYKQTVWEVAGLTDGAHTLRIEVLGQKRAGAGSTAVNVDALDVVHSLASRRYDQTDPTVGYAGTWQQNADAGMYGGSYKISSTTSSAVTMTFAGKSVAWVGALGPNYGMANVSVDGGAPTTVDLYSGSLRYKQTLWNSGTLSDTTHTVRFEVSGNKNAASGGRAINFDAFDIVGTAVQADAAPPVTTSNLQPSYTTTATIALTAVDTGAGVASTKFRLDGGSWQTGTTASTSVVGTHTLEYYSVDRIGNTEAIVGPTTFSVLARYEEQAADLTYSGTWNQVSDGSMSGGAYRASTVPSSAVETTFTGTRADWIGTIGGGFGIARVILDGTEVALVDLYSPVLRYRQVLWSSGTLTDQVHTLRIEVTGTKNASATGTTVPLDAIDVLGALGAP